MGDFSERLRKLAKDQDLEAQVRKALEQRKASGGVAVPKPETRVQPLHYSRSTPALGEKAPPPGWWPAPAKPLPAGGGEPVTIDKACPGEEVEVVRLGKAYLVVNRFPCAGDDGGHPAAIAYSKAFASPVAGMHERVAARCRGGSYEPGDLVFFDLETTGLSACPLFLIGAMTWEGDSLVVRQFFARHYGEEGAVLGLFGDLLKGRRLLVSFNGKTFDLPFVRTRAAANGVPLTIGHQHFDLLHEARRVWKGDLPDCKLQTLERYLCGRVRTGDIPGREIPDAYHGYVRTGDATLMARVLHHNLLDLVTLAELMAMLPPMA